MEEQQQHLINLLTQRKDILIELENLNKQSSQKRDVLLKVEGAIEYLNTIGVELPEPDPTAEEISSEETTED